MTPERWRRVTEIFHAARAIPDATARDAYLGDACGADPSLRGEVEALLGAHEDAGSFGEQPVGVGASGVGQLAAGSTLGPYQIEGLIDVGGMGEVYRAHDTALNRDVAIKVLPAGVVDDPDRLLRFEREAQTLAALNHPNIAHVYGLEQSGDTPAIVMELVEGPTLADRIGRGPIPVDEALLIAHQIAEGLEAAHERGVIHRDLKPANIKVGDDGAVKLLDFGLAKAFAPDGSAIAAQAMNAPTDTSPAMTQPGVILGTAAYMAPEQARGKAVDKRVDVWAFGTVLYEMLTGRRCFDGHTVTDVLAAVVKSEPDWNVLPPETPDAVRRLLRRCLTKDVKERLHDIGDARLEVDAAVSEPTALSSGTSDAHRPPALPRALLVIAAVAATVFCGAVAVWILWPARGEQAETRFPHIIPTDHALRRWGRPVMAVSHDGRQVVYNTEAGLYRFTLDDPEARLIPGTEGDLTSPFFSPDGQSIGYYDPETGQLMHIGIGGGAPVPICSATGPFEVSWEADGTIFFAQQDGIHRVPSNGGPAQVLIAAGQGERLRRPQLLPDGDSVLFTVIDAERNEAQIVVQSIRTGERTPLGIAGRQGRYLSTGHIIYGVEDTLYAVPFDANRLVAFGTPVPVERHVGRDFSTGLMHYEISENGTLVYITGDSANYKRALVWVTPDGGEDPIATEPGAYFLMDISPSGDQVLVDRLDATGDDILVLTLSSGVFDRLRSTTKSLMGLWTPDNRALVYAVASDDERRDLYVRPVDGSADPELFAEAQNRLYPASFTGDGKLVAVRVAEDGNRDLVLFDGAGSAAVPLVETEHLETRAQVSPDGQWLAYVSDHTGSRQVFIQPIAEAAGRTPVSPPSSDNPRWAPDGRAIFYTHEGFMWSAAVTFTPTLTVSREPERLFPTADYYIGDDLPQGLAYDVHPRTGKFLMLKRLSQDPVSLVVTVDWFERLRRLASGG